MAAQQVDTLHHLAEFGCSCHVMSEGGRATAVPWYGLSLAVERAFRVPRVENRIHVDARPAMATECTHLDVDNHHVGRVRGEGEGESAPRAAQPLLC
jgi:hypothetical protein